MIFRYMAVGVLIGAIGISIMQLMLGRDFLFGEALWLGENKSWYTDGVDGASGQGINTEWKNMPEMIVDENALKDLPQPTTQEQDIDEIKEELQENTDSEPVALPTGVNLDIPFFPQAPDADRSLPRKEACEEASIVLAAHYFADKEMTKEEFKADVLALVELQKDLFGDYVDTSVEETAQLFEAFFGNASTKIIENLTIEDIKSELAQGHPIVAPFAWRKLQNSHFMNGWPRYHMLVIKGYDEQYFYTNDVGTRVGKDFPYTYDVIMDALHDLTDGDITTGEKRILVLYK